MPNGAGGGGGGGIVGVGNTFTGAAEALEIYGEHAAGYSGPLGINTTAVTHFDFTSGNYYFNGNISTGGVTLAGNTGSGSIVIINVLFNGTTVFSFKSDSAAEDMPSYVVMPLLIPPYTEVKVTVECDQTSAPHKCDVNIIGRIYRG